MKKPVAALLAVLACACVAAPAAADEMSDLYAKIMADPGNTALNLEYAALAEKSDKPRLALAAYERVLLNDPGNAEAQSGIRRVTRRLLGDSTRWVASLGAGWNSNPAEVPDHEESSPLGLASLAVHDERFWGSTAWQSDALGVVQLVTDEDRLNYGYLGAETGPVFDTDTWFTIHPAVGAGWSYFDNTTFYSEAIGSLTLEGIQGGADQIARVKVGYRTYSGKFTTDDGWFVHVNGRWGVPHIFGDRDVLIFAPWFRWSDINGAVPVALNIESEPGRYTEFGADVSYFVPVADNVVLGGNVTVSDRNYRDPGLLSGHDDRHDTTWTPGATVIFKHVFAFQSDIRLQYRHRHNDSNDATREFDEDILTLNIDKRF